MPAPAPGLPLAAGPLCLGLAAASDALRAATARRDPEAMLAQDARLRALADCLPRPGEAGIARGDVLAALAAALEAVREAEEVLQEARPAASVAQEQTRRLRLAYGEGMPR